MRSESQAGTNVAGIVGMVMVLIATVLSPTGFLGVTLPFLMVLGFGGLIVCGVSLAWLPRWPGVVGLIVGLVCVAGWIAFFGWAFLHVRNSAIALGLSIGEHGQMCMSAIALTEAAESQRTSTGGAAPSVVLTKVDAEYEKDPWGHPYRYMVTNTPRGFTFLSDGPDGVSNTSDDIDILTIQRDGMFSLPPMSGAAATQPSAVKGAATDVRDREFQQSD
ncbi:MAG TPA: type II secretion system protein GspG [Phycisphaerales bacterium]|nr:type II secretion system protein GspG [Phycisphaerales bacterium]